MPTQARTSTTRKGKLSTFSKRNSTGGVKSRMDALDHEVGKIHEQLKAFALAMVPAIELVKQTEEAAALEAFDDVESEMDAEAEMEAVAEAEGSEDGEEPGSLVLASQGIEQSS